MPRPAGSKVTPAYCLHKSSGRAYVTLDGRAIYLGTFGTPESREKYDRTIGEWLANGRRLAPPPVTPASLSVAEVLVAFKRHAEEYHRTSDGQLAREYENYIISMRPLKKLYSGLPVLEFGPVQMKAVRREMIDMGWGSTHINRQLGRLRHIFNWAASEAIIPAAIADAVAKVKGLRFGKTEARESEPVEPVADEHFRPTLPFLPPMIKSMVKLQLLTGMRPAKFVPCAIATSTRRRGSCGTIARPDTRLRTVASSDRFPLDPRRGTSSRPIWAWTPRLSYSAHPGRRRIVANASARPEKRRFNRRKSNALPMPAGDGAKVAPGDFYDVHAYRRAIARACDAAFPPPDHLAQAAR